MKIANVIKSLSQEHPKLSVPPEVALYLDQQEANGHQIRRSGSGQPLVEYMQDIGVEYERIAQLFNRNSQIAFQISFPSLLRMSRNQLNAFFLKQFSVLFDLQEVILDNETTTGFNRHGKEHLKEVTNRVLKLLSVTEKASDNSKETETEASIAGYLHDAGNIISRKNHSFYSAYLMGLFFSDIDHNQQTLSSFKRVLEAVIFHEVEASQHLSSFAELGPAALSLIVADKSDVSSRRVSMRSNVPEAVSDLHVLLNLLAAHSKITCRKNLIRWEIRFSPGATQEQSALFPELLKRARRVWVPEEWQKLYRQDNIEYMFIFNATFLRVYFPRLLLALRAVFALSPDIKTFELVINDEERGVSLKRLFKRDDYQKKLYMVGKNLFKNSTWEEMFYPDDQRK
jgi:hypothetical protein